MLTYLLEEDGGGEPNESELNLGTYQASDPNESIMFTRNQLRANFARSLLLETSPEMIKIVSPPRGNLLVDEDTSSKY